jgi:hypothetical protein
MPQIKIYNGSIWVAPNAKVRGSSSWLDPEMKYWNGSSWQTLEGSAEAPTVDALADGRTNARLDAACYSGCAFYATGIEYEYNSAASLVSSRTWLTAGIADDVWLMWTRTGGSLSDWDSLGSGKNNIRQNCASTQAFRIIDSISSGAGGAETIIGYFRFYDAASGGNLLDTTSGATWSARRWHDACPLCCFTPETPVTLASGLQVPIATVTKGMEILVFNPVTKRNEAQEMAGMITRTGRKMYRITFDDGRHLDASDDHPFDVKGKGAASINPVGEYKDMGTPAKLEVNDVVTGQDGRPHGIMAFEEIDYPGTVYTFENSLFYANGLLVY